MNKTYHYEILPPADIDIRVSDEFDTIEECIEACKADCKALGIDYNEPYVKLFLTDDFGENYEECTEEGELAG